MKRSKKWAILLLAAGLAVIALSGCSRTNTTPTPASQIVAVQQGPLQVQIPGTGNLAFSQTAELAFQGAGTVDQINVDVGDAVKAGQVLATLDKAAWQDTLTSLQRAVTTAQRNELSLEIALNNSNQTLQQALGINPSTDVQVAKANLDNALSNYQYVQSNFAGSPAIVNRAKAQLDAAATALNALTTA